MNWFLHHKGVEVHINPLEIPDFKEVVVDVETDGQDNIHCVGVCGDPHNVYVAFMDDQLNYRIFDYLKNRKLVAHHWRADIKWLERYGITKEQVSFDTMLGEYVLNSTKKGFGLKQLCAEQFGFNWPGYKELTKNKRYIEIACKANFDLYIKKVRHYKTKPDAVTLKLPKEITLPDLPNEIVANYNGWDVHATWTLLQTQRSRMTDSDKKFLSKIEHPTSQILYEMHRKGVNVDTGVLLKIHKHYRTLMRCYKKAWKHYAGDTLITSPSKVLVFLNAHHIPVPDTNEDTLKPFASNPIIKTLLNWRGASKICTTYTRPLYKLAMASIDGRIHCNFKQHTDTGRLSAARPNLQNQPPELRGAFVAAPGYTFVNADWSQIELRIPAHFSKEPLMVDTFVNGKKKIHQVTADQIGRSYHIGKTVNFLLTNSGGAYRLAEVAGIPVDEAFDVFRKFHEKFATYYRWTQAEKKLAYQNKGVRTLFGRFVPLPQIRCPEEKVRARYERKAISVKVQGSSADMIKAAMIKLYQKYNLIPAISLHDELMFEVKIEDADRVAGIVKTEMESIVKLIVPLVAEVGIGTTWASAKAK